MWFSVSVIYFCVSSGLGVAAQVWLLLRWRKLRVYEWAEERRRELVDDSISSVDVFRREQDRNSELYRLIRKWLRREAVPASLSRPIALYVVTVANAILSMVMVFLVGSIGF